MRKPVGESARALVLMLAGGWNREKKESSVLGQYRGTNHGGGGSAKRTPEEGLLVPSDVPDGLTNINGFRNSGTV